MRDRSIRIRNALTMGVQFAKWFSAWTNKPHTVRVWFGIQHCAKKNSRETPGCGPAPLEVSV